MSANTFAARFSGGPQRSAGGASDGGDAGGELDAGGVLGPGGVSTERAVEVLSAAGRGAVAEPQPARASPATSAPVVTRRAYVSFDIVGKVAQVSTLGYAILGLLARKPRTGYEISRAMAAPIGYMWTANHSQIYPELATLESNGLVRHRVVDGPGPRDTKRYSLTAQGRTALRRWVDSPLPEQPARSELMLRVRCLWLIAPDRARTFIGEVRERHLDRLAAYRAEETAFEEEGPAVDDPGSPVFAAHATLAWGISYEQHLVSWCDWLLERLAVHR